MAMNSVQHKALRGKVSREWPAWQEKLAAVLARLEEDQYLVISTKHGNQFVQFFAQGAFGMRAETTSNPYRKKSEKLSALQVRALLELGWNEPSGRADESTPENDPDGSPNYFLDFATPVAFGAVADLAVRTFAEILRVPHPAWLQFKACGDDGSPLDLPELGLKASSDTAGEGGHWDVHQLLLDTLRGETGIENLAYDKDGDIAVRYGSALLFVRFMEYPQSVRIYSPLLEEVEEQPGLYERLNDINAHSILLRYTYRNEGIWAVADLGADPFDKQLVVSTFRYCCQIADGMGTSLQSEFAGKTFIPASMPSSMKH